jgi:hypothetical protein
MFERPKVEDSDYETRKKAAHEYAVSIVGPNESKDYYDSMNYWDDYWDLYWDKMYQDASLYELSNQEEDNLDEEPYWELDYDFGSDYEFDDDLLPFASQLSKDQSDMPLSLHEAMEQLQTLIRLIAGDDITNGLFFENPESRKEVYEFSAAIAEYLKQESITNLVIVDRSSRPLYIGVIEYWRKKFPGESRPNIYFVNPKGFKSSDAQSNSELLKANSIGRNKGDIDESIYLARAQQDIKDEFISSYSKLYEDRDNPVLIFDTCIHSGDTLASVVDIFEQLGFEDARVGSVNQARPESKVQTDFHITDLDPKKGCYPFDRDRMIEKTFEHVYSRPTQDSVKRSASIAIRKEIKKIMQEYLD